MAIPRVDITSEINDWQNAVYGEEVRSANVSALTKLQTQINAASDEIEDELEIIEGAVNTANAASSAANTAVSTATQAVSDAQDAIDQANAAIASAQGYAQDASDSADAAAAVVVTVNNTAARAEAAEHGAITAQHAAEAAVPADYSELVEIVKNTLYWTETVEIVPPDIRDADTLGGQYSASDITTLVGKVDEKIRYVDMDVHATADTWQSFAVPNYIDGKKVLNVYSLNSNAYWLLWYWTGSQIRFLRINTNGQSLVVGNTEANLRLRVIYYS